MRDSVKTRQIAALAFQDILKNSAILEQSLSRQDGFNHLDGRDRAFARAIVATSFRRYAQIQAALKPFIRKAPPDFVQAVLHIAAAQILFLKIPAHAAVGEAVDVLKAQSSYKGFANMANAVLRNVVKEGPKLSAALAPSANIPSWIRKSWDTHYGKAQTRKMAAMLMKDPVLDITIRGDAAQWAKKLGGVKLGTQTVRLPTIGDIKQIEGFDEGQWWVQDIAAALPAQIANHLSGGLAGKTVLDLCAAPGGKTLQMAAMGAQVTALDQSEKRLEKLRENLDRTGLEAQIICADALEYKSMCQYDVILLDAPCSATGTFRRHPDVLYNRHIKTLSELIKIQKRLLRQAANWLKPHGILIYSVCSLQPEESDPQIIRFLRQMPDFRLISIPNAMGIDLPDERFEGGTLRTIASDLSDYGGMDGFFIAALTQKP